MGTASGSPGHKTAPQRPQAFTPPLAPPSPCRVVARPCSVPPAARHHGMLGLATSRGLPSQARPCGRPSGSPRRDSTRRAASCSGVSSATSARKGAARRHLAPRGWWATASLLAPGAAAVLALAVGFVGRAAASHASAQTARSTTASVRRMRAGASRATVATGATRGGHLNAPLARTPTAATAARARRCTPASSALQTRPPPPRAARRRSTAAVSLASSDATHASRTRARLCRPAL